MAIDLKKIKPNIPQVALEDYFYLIAGIPKSGKTTLFARLVEEYYKDINNGLLLAFERGYSALRVNAVDINEWDDVEEITEQLIDEKDELPFKLIGIDTADIMWDMAQEKVIKEWNMRNPRKRTNDISGVGAKGESDQGYGVGYNRAKQKIRDVIDKLTKAGYGVMVLTHSKDKEVKQKDGLKYDQLAVSLSSSARDVFINMADFIVFVTIEKEKDENENIDTKRYLYFRTDGYVEAGSRFKNVPERIEYSVDGFLDVFKNAVESEFESKEEMKQAAKKQKEEKEKKVKEFIENKDKDVSLDDLMEKIKETAYSLKDKGVAVSTINEAMGDIKNIDTLDAAKEVLDNLKKL